MKSRTLTCLTTTMTLFTALAIPVGLAAEERQQNNSRFGTSS
jgi:hypothetical protein